MYLIYTLLYPRNGCKLRALRCRLAGRERREAAGTRARQSRQRPGPPHADLENGPPPGTSPPMRMTASWSGSKRTYRIEVCGTKMRPIASSPSDPPRSDRQPPTRHEAMQKARLAVHRRSACSGVKALRNTSDARRQAAKLCYRFGPLTPSARSAKPDRRRRDMA